MRGKSKSNTGAATSEPEDPPDFFVKELVGDADIGRAAPVYNVFSLFGARRDLQPIVQVVLEGSGITQPESDILVVLYGLRKLGWKECQVYGDGFVSFKELKSAVSNDPSLFTRRVNGLSSSGLQLIEVKEGREVDPQQRGNSRFVRITEKGIEKAKLIWGRYIKLSEAALKGFSTADWEAHLRVNEGLSRVLREWADAGTWVLRLLE
jgi:DNA-binding MarR family transcriptional regulator